MGTDYYPKVIIGVRFSWNKFFKKEHSTVPIPYTQLPKRHKESCSVTGCPILDKDLSSYCSACGCSLKRRHTETVSLIPGVVDGNELLYDDVVKFREWNVVQVGEGESDSYVFIGFNFVDGGDDYNGKMSKIDITTMANKKESLKADLEEFGLWDEDTFGLWSFMHVSC